MRMVQAAQWPLQPTDRHRERRNAEVGLGLAATRGKPEQVRDSCRQGGAVRRLGTGERRYRQQNKGQLEWPPTPIHRDVDLLELGFPAPPPLERVEATHPLLPHRTIGEAKCLEGLGIVEY